MYILYMNYTIIILVICCCLCSSSSCLSLFGTMFTFLSPIISFFKGLFNNPLTDAIGSISGAISGIVSGKCEDGYVNESGLCYLPAQKGYTCVANKCYINCPNGFLDTGLNCQKPASYPWKWGDTAGDYAANLTRCSFDALAYGNQYQGYGFGCTQVAGVSYMNCPTGFTDTGLNCMKPAAYDRGVGTVPTGGTKK